MAGRANPHINKGAKNPSTIFDLKMVAVVLALKILPMRLLLAQKKDGQPKPSIPLFGVYQLSLARIF